MILVPFCSCLCPIYWSHVWSREWRCSWSSADRRCSNYIWVIDNLIANKGASYIRDLTVYHVTFIIFLNYPWVSNDYVLLLESPFRVPISYIKEPNIVINGNELFIHSRASYNVIHSLRPRDAYMRQILPMAWCLFGAKPLSEPMLAYC